MPPVNLVTQTHPVKGFFLKLSSRNRALWYFGWLNLLGGISCLVLSQASKLEVMGISAWIKPAKFFFSIAILSFTMSWYLVYLNRREAVKWYSRILIITLGFEILVITWQASRGQLSHFNVSTPVNGLLFSLMGIAIVLFTVWTLYIGILFFRQKEFPPMLPAGYVWGIRLGILLFVLFAFEGGQMAASLRHSFGGPDGGEGLPFLNWSTRHGDLRVAHFFGIHALQVLPFAGYFGAKTRGRIFVAAGTYFIFVIILYWQALLGFPLIP